MFILQVWANSILPWSRASQLQKNTLHLWSSHRVSGSKHEPHRTFMLSTRLCVHPNLSLSASGSSLYLTLQLPDFFSSGPPCCICSPVINEPSASTDVEKLMKAACHPAKLLPLTYLPFFSPLCDSCSFCWQWGYRGSCLLSFPPFNCSWTTLAFSGSSHVFYLRVERSPGLHLRQEVGERVKLFIKAGLLLQQSLAEEDRKVFK